MMTDLKPYEPTKFGSKRLTNELSEPWGELPGKCLPTSPAWKPEYIFFTYVRINNGRQQCYVRHYYVPIGEFGNSAIGEIEKTLFKNARKELKYQKWPPYGADFSMLDFVRTDCYFSLVLDERDWRLSPIDPTDEIDETLVFRKNKIIHIGDGHYGEESYSKNDAFFEFERVKYPDPGDDTIRDGFRAKFLSQGPYFKDDGAIIKKYAVDIHLKMPLYNDGAEPQYWITIVLDPPIPNPGPPKIFVPEAMKTVL